MPRVVTPQIAWHGRDSAGKYKNDPLLTADFCRDGEREGQYLLATGGADNCVRIWRLSTKEISTDASSKESSLKGESCNLRISFVVSLEGHAATVNCVRFSPNGEFLASGSDDYRVLLWKRNVQKTADNWKWCDIKEKNEVTYKMLSGHKSDVYSLDWSPCGCFLASCSTDNTVSVWNVVRGKRVENFDGHSHYVQGVAWDPRDRFILSQSCDRSCRVYGKKKGERLCPDDELFGTRGFRWKKNSVKCIQKIFKRELAPSDVPEGAKEAENTTAADVVPSNDTKKTLQSSTIAENQDVEDSAKSKKKAPKHAMFVDENVQSFFRRLSFTPDGSACVVPAAQIMTSSSESATACTYLFARNQWARPAVAYPTHADALSKSSQAKKRITEPSIIVRCSPILYELRGSTDENASPVLKLPYRSVFAVATFSCVLLYDTEQLTPIGVVENIHFAQITDMTWSCDGTVLVVSSQDGYCTVITFEAGEIGEPLPAARVPAFMKRDRRSFANSSGVADTSSRSIDEAAGEKRKRVDARSSESNVSQTGPQKKRASLVAVPDASGVKRKRATLIAVSDTNLAVPSEAFR